MAVAAVLAVLASGVGIRVMLSLFNEYMPPAGESSFWLPMKNFLGLVTGYQSSSGSRDATRPLSPLDIR